MIPKPFDDIDNSDIDALVANGANEVRTLEYKESLPGKGNDDRKEFLADVSSFANAAGGDLIYGVKGQRDEQSRPTGKAESVVGLEGFNADADVLRLENMLRDGIQPRISGIQIKAIDGYPLGPVLLIRIPQGWNAPHRSLADRHFYSRNSVGKYPLDVEEIRSVFAQANNVVESTRRFLDMRLARIVADETPVLLGHGARMVLHLIPRSAVIQSPSIDLQSFVKVDEDRKLLRPMYMSSWSSRYNYDGFATSGERSYVQLFRSSSIEFAAGDIAGAEQGLAFLPAVLVTQELIKSTELGLQALQRLGISPPVYLSVRLVGVKDHKLAADDRGWLRTYSIDRDVLILPDVMISEWGAEAHTLLRPVFDALWQTVGYPNCLYYDDDGSWLQPRL